MSSSFGRMLRLVKDSIEAPKESLSKNVRVVVLSGCEDANVACVGTFITDFSAWIEQISLLKVKSPLRRLIIIKIDVKISFWVKHNFVAGGLELALESSGNTVDAGTKYGTHCLCKSIVLF